MVKFTTCVGKSFAVELWKIGGLMTCVLAPDLSIPAEERERLNAEYLAIARKYWKAKRDSIVAKKAKQAAELQGGKPLPSSPSTVSGIDIQCNHCFIWRELDTHTG